MTGDTPPVEAEIDHLEVAVVQLKSALQGHLAQIDRPFVVVDKRLGPPV